MPLFGSSKKHDEQDSHATHGAGTGLLHKGAGAGGTGTGTGLGHTEQRGHNEPGYGTGTGTTGTGLGHHEHNGGHNHGTGTGTGTGTGLGRNEPGYGTGTGTGLGHHEQKGAQNVGTQPGYGTDATHGHGTHTGHGTGIGHDTTQSNYAGGATNAPLSGNHQHGAQRQTGNDPAIPNAEHLGRGAGHQQGQSGGHSTTGKIQHAIGSAVGSDSLKAKGLQKEREAESLKVQGAEIGEAERLEHEARQRRERAVAHGAHPQYKEQGGQSGGY